VQEPVGKLRVILTEWGRFGDGVIAGQATTHNPRTFSVCYDSETNGS
jgi:hypothetical protein